MKYLGMALFLILPCTSNAGYFVKKNMYSTAHLAVGVGSSLTEAIEDAKSAIPSGTKYDFYEPDSDFNGPQSQCVNEVLWTEKDECWKGGSIQYVIPLRHVTR